MVKMTLWTVQGKFLIPGSREQVSFGPMRVCDSSKQSASKHLAGILRDKFHKELSKVNRHGGRPFDFGDNFALGNLKWEAYTRPGLLEALKGETA